MQEVTTRMREKRKDPQGRMEKENKTLATERCKNIDTLYINKIIIIIIIIIIISKIIKSLN